MDNHQEHLHRGFSWLGGAMVLTKAADFGSILVVLLFLTKAQLGIASLVVAIGTVIEALNGLGASAALVQAPSLSRVQLDTLFWFIVAASLVVAGLTLVVAPWFAAFYGFAGMATLFVAVAAKQLLAAVGVIPLALLSRELKYERIAVVNVSSTLATSLTRIVLAVRGAGAWAIVAAYAAYGLYSLIGSLAARPFRPRLQFRMAEIKSLVRYGMRATTSNVFEQMFSNVHYLLVGWFYGAAPLGVYRVAFEVGMQGALAASTLINRTALPVFARVAAVREQVAQSLVWSLRRIVTVVAPLVAATALAASPLMSLVHDRRGLSYAAAALPLKLLAAAALLRVVSQLLYPVVLGAGRPRTAARFSAATFFLLSAGFVLVGFSLRAHAGIIGVAAVWLAVYPLLLIWEAYYLRRHWDIRTTRLVRALFAPLVAAGALAAMVEIAWHLIAAVDPWLRLGLILGATALTYAGLFANSRRHRIAEAS